MIANKLKFEGPALLMVWEGDDIVKTTRKMIEAADQAVIDTYKCSDSIEAANREIALAFTPEEMVECAKIGRSETFIAN